ncbi:BON domain-containing protein [Rhodoferax sp. GW822-FHT02A01]|uniref:BON domain-containing protein n=1 Tax=Rhodoferax sp. GW822-FHT02A01 TaxID=3141537 RepID=UPI00315DC297
MTGLYLQTTRSACGWLLAGLLGCAAALAQDEERANFLEIPFLQVTDGIKTCPRQQEPRMTRAQAVAQSHSRAERGTSCFQAGRCRLPNAYLYDKEIIPRVKQAILVDGRFTHTSIWVEGQRRWVWLKGCATSRAEAQAVEDLVRSIDDVEAVVNELSIQLPAGQ